MAAHGNGLAAALQKVRTATQAAWATGVPEEALANATPYLQAFGHMVLAWIWLDVALAALSASATSNVNNAGHGNSAHGNLTQGQLAAMRYFHVYELPKIDAWLAVVSSREAVCREMQDAWF